MATIATATNASVTTADVEARRPRREPTRRPDARGGAYPPGATGRRATRRRSRLTRPTSCRAGVARCRLGCRGTARCRRRRRRLLSETEERHGQPSAHDEDDDHEPDGDQQERRPGVDVLGEQSAVVSLTIGDASPGGRHQRCSTGPRERRLDHGAAAGRRTRRSAIKFASMPIRPSTAHAPHPVIRLLVTVVAHVIAAAIGLIVAAAILDDMALDTSGFFIAVLIFTGVDLLAQPLIIKIGWRHAERDDRKLGVDLDVRRAGRHHNRLRWPAHQRRDDVAARHRDRLGGVAPRRHRASGHHLQALAGQRGTPGAPPVRTYP